jgi:hypothetical protein
MQTSKDGTRIHLSWVLQPVLPGVTVKKRRSVQGRANWGACKRVIPGQFARARTPSLALVIFLRFFVTKRDRLALIGRTASTLAASRERL